MLKRISIIGTQSTTTLLAFVVTLILGTLVPRAEGPTVPDGAYQAAVVALEERFKPAASASPAFYRLEDSVDVSQATLGKPFWQFVVRGPGLDRFLESTEDDPRGFAAIEEYCFPIVTPNGDDLGAMIILRNADENGIEFLPGEGRFVFSGYILPGSSAISDASALERMYSTGSQICWVRFIAAGVPTRLLVEERDGRAFAGSSPDNLKSLAEDSRFVKMTILK